jgi:hypothetical protein
MATILISDPSELLANRGQPNRGLSKHDDDRAADIQHTWYRPIEWKYTASLILGALRDCWYNHILCLCP